MDHERLAKVIRISLAVVVMIIAIRFCFLFMMGLASYLTGARVYGSMSFVMNLMMFLFIAFLAFLIWPRESRKKQEQKNQFDSLQDGGSRADFIASTAASRLGVSSDQFDAHLTKELRCAPIDVMNTWDEMGEDVGVELSSDDFPDVSSIEELRKRLAGFR